MRKAGQLLLYASRVLAICAVLAGLVTGLFEATLGADFTCFDSCPTPEFFFSNLGTSAVWLMTPCVALESLALVTFLAYCAATGQARRAVTVILVLVVGGLAGAAALSALMRQGQANLPVTQDDILAEGSVVAWASQWGQALATVAVAWSSVLAFLQWGR
jgi:hypothetical protein